MDIMEAPLEESTHRITRPIRKWEVDEMIAKTQTRPTTAEDFLNMPDDGFRYELIMGALVKMPPPGQYHAEIGSIVDGSLGPHVRGARIGKVYTEYGYILSFGPDTVRAPDLSFISRERLDTIGETDGYWRGAPDLAVEIISPNDRYTDVADKVQEWLDAGALMVIVINPRSRTVAVHRSNGDVETLAEGDTLNGAEVIPGWSMAVSEIFDL